MERRESPRGLGQMHGAGGRFGGPGIIKCNTENYIYRTTESTATLQLGFYLTRHLLSIVENANACVPLAT